MNNNHLSKLAKYGVVGVAIATLALSGFVINRAFNLMENHLQESTKTQEKLIGVVETLNGTVEDLSNMLKFSPFKDIK